MIGTIPIHGLPLCPARSVVLTALLWAAGFHAPAFAEMYKWVDENGNVQYTQHPPPGDIKAETIKPPPKVDSESALQELDEQQKQLEEVRAGRQKQGEEVAKAEEEKAWYVENCRRAQATLASYQVPNALIQQADGSRTRISEEDRQAGLAKANEMIKEYCK